MPNVIRWVWFPIGAIVRFIARNGRRIAISVAGVVLVGVGLALLVLPGPGLLLVIAGLAVLATEYVWAQRALNYARRKGTEVKDAALRRTTRRSRPEG